MVGEEYRKIISSLGVSTSDPNSWISKETWEFAKRYLYRGHGITPFPIFAVMGHLGEIPLLVSARSGEEKKGLISRDGILRALGELARPLYRRRKEVSKLRGLSSRFLNGNRLSQEERGGSRFSRES